MFFKLKFTKTSKNIAFINLTSDITKNNAHQINKKIFTFFQDLFTDDENKKRKQGNESWKNYLKRMIKANDLATYLQNLIAGLELLVRIQGLFRFHSLGT